LIETQIDYAMDKEKYISNLAKQLHHDKKLLKFFTDKKMEDKIKIVEERIKILKDEIKELVQISETLNN
jgi:hypothetical protein